VTVDAADGDLAWEQGVAASAPAAPRTWAVRLRAAAGSGLIAGVVPGLVVGAVYFAQHHDVDLPWIWLATMLAAYAPGSAVLLAVAIELMTMACDRLPGGAVFNPLTAGGVGGALGSIVPGAIGVATFGSYRGPFVGTALIAIGLVGSSLLIAVPAARRARQARKLPARTRSLVVAAVAATAIIAVVAAVIAPIIVATSFAQAHMIDAQGQPLVAVGAAVGAVSGAIVGLYIGLVVALARR
jgi:hypothetical protein